MHNEPPTSMCIGVCVCVVMYVCLRKDVTYCANLPVDDIWVCVSI